MNCGRQPGGASSGLSLLRESEVRVARHAVGARGRPAAIELPVQQRERDVVAEPDLGARDEHVDRVLVTADPSSRPYSSRMAVDPSVLIEDHGDQGERWSGAATACPVDPAWVAEHQRQQQDALDRGEHPAGQSARSRGRDQGEGHQREDRDRHRPGRFALDDRP